MPRHYTFICEVCAKIVTRPAAHPPRFCSRACYTRHRIAEIESRIGESVGNAITRLYRDERKTFRQIATFLGINARTVSRTLTRLGVPIRHGGEAVAVQWENNPQRRASIGQAFARSARKRTGPKHPRWVGGRVPRGRRISSKAWKGIAAIARARDGDKCTRCGMPKAEHVAKFGRLLEVHHVIPYRISQSDDLDNLRTLCCVCHMTVEQQITKSR